MNRHDRVGRVLGGDSFQPRQQRLGRGRHRRHGAGDIVDDAANLGQFVFPGSHCAETNVGAVEAGQAGGGSADEAV